MVEIKKKKINEELDRMHKLFEYNSRDTFGKTNLLTEKSELDTMVKKFRSQVHLYGQFHDL